MINQKKEVIIYVVIVLLVILAFLRFTPIGIELSYWLMGGKEPVDESETINFEDIEFEYKKQISIYEKYCDSENPEQQKWAETARQKANELANEYNTAKKEFVLNGIGE